MSQNLAQRAGAVDPTKAAIIDGLWEGYSVDDIRRLEDTVIRVRLAQALIDGIAGNETDLVVSDLLPVTDLLDQTATSSPSEKERAGIRSIW